MLVRLNQAKSLLCRYVCVDRCTEVCVLMDMHSIFDSVRSRVFAKLRYELLLPHDNFVPCRKMVFLFWEEGCA